MKSLGSKINLATITRVYNFHRELIHQLYIPLKGASRIGGNGKYVYIDENEFIFQN